MYGVVSSSLVFISYSVTAGTHWQDRNIYQITTVLVKGSCPILLDDPHLLPGQLKNCSTWP